MNLIIQGPADLATPLLRLNGTSDLELSKTLNRISSSYLNVHYILPGSCINNYLFVYYAWRDEMDVFSILTYIINHLIC